MIKDQVDEHRDGWKDSDDKGTRRTERNLRDDDIYKWVAKTLKPTRLAMTERSTIGHVFRSYF